MRTFFEVMFIDPFLEPWITSAVLGAATLGGLVIARHLLVRTVQMQGWDPGQIKKFFRGSMIVLLSVAMASLPLDLPKRFDRSRDYTVLALMVYFGARLLVLVLHFMINQKNFGSSRDELSSRSIKTNLRVLMSILVWTGAVLFYLGSVGVNISAAVTGLGIGGIAVALAVQSFLGDILSSFSIAMDKPFEIGDFIVVDQLRGTVEHIGLKTTRVRSIDGELLIFSNSDLTRARVQNFQKMRDRRVLFRIGVTYNTLAEKLAKVPEIIRKAISEQSKARFERCHFLSFGDSALVFEIVFYVEDQDYQVYCAVHHQVNLAIAVAFREEGIVFAYPTQSIYIESFSPPNGSGVFNSA